MSLNSLLATVVTIILSGCATRGVIPVTMVQPGDDRLSCSEIATQVQANRSQVSDLLKTDKKVEQDNVGRGVLTVVPVFGLAAAASMDLSNSEQIQARALQDRIQRLSYLSQDKGCPTS